MIKGVSCHPLPTPPTTGKEEIITDTSNRNSDDDRWYTANRRRGCEPRDALELLAFFHDTFPVTLAAIKAGAREVLALAERLDAAAVQDGDAVLIRLLLWRLDRLAWRAEDDVPAFYGDVPAPRRGAAS